MPIPNSLETAKVCYAMAYFVLPDYVRQQPDKLVERLAEGDRGAVFLFLVACKAASHQAVKEEALAFSTHEGDLETGHHYWIVQYPTPPSVNFIEPEFIPVTHPERTGVLAPYFSAILRDRGSQALDYYILGQAPFGGTTLRRVSGRINSNLGPGCDPEIGAFVKLLSERPR